MADAKPVRVWPGGCELNGCVAHYPPGRNLAAEGCVCPAWFDGGGWHLIERRADCPSAAHELGVAAADVFARQLDALRSITAPGEEGQ